MGVKKFNFIEYMNKNREEGRIIWIFNICPERYWNDKVLNVNDRKENEIVNHIEEMNLLLTRKQDLLILRDIPSEVYLAYMESCGFEIPSIVCPKQYKQDERGISELVLDDKELLEKIKLFGSEYDDVYFLPYAVTELEEKIADICDLNLVCSNSMISKSMNNKVFSRNFAQELGMKIPDGVVCSSLKEVKKVSQIMLKNQKRILIKYPCGASGQGLYLIKDEKKLNVVMAILEKFYAYNNTSGWIVEKWYDKKFDINYQIYVQANGNIEVFSIKEQKLDDVVYIGSIMPPRIHTELEQKYIEYGELIGRELYKRGFYGVLGVDSFITKENDIMPIIEINARFTLSTYVSFLTNKYPNKLMCSFYKKFMMIDNLNFEYVMNRFKENNLLFNETTQKGVLCYVESTMKSDGRNCNGRFFAIVIAENEQENMEIYSKLESVVKDFRRC